MSLPTLSDEISQSALDHYGIPHQAMKWIEELQELTLEIIGYLEGSNLMSQYKLKQMGELTTDVLKHAKNGTAYQFKTIEDEEQELAMLLEASDVLLCVNQMQVTLNRDLKQQVEYKETRLKRQIAAEQNEGVVV